MKSNLSLVSFPLWVNLSARKLKVSIELLAEIISQCNAKGFVQGRLQQLYVKDKTIV